MFRSSKPPFDDVNVRIAMQKAINLEELNTAFYKGVGDTTPWGHLSSFAKGYHTPYAEWPEDVQRLYEYDPAEAERLLDEAGYSRGADGIRFEAGWDICETCWMANDPDFAEVVTTYWDKIGVDVRLVPLIDEGEWWTRLTEGTNDGLTTIAQRHSEDNPVWVTAWWQGEPGMSSNVTDPVFNAMVDEALDALDSDEQKRLYREIDMYIINQMWYTHLPRVPSYLLWQPWLKGYRGEQGGNSERILSTLAYVWVDQELKEELGH